MDPIDLDELATRLLMCGRCEARPGKPCTTVAGGITKRTHSARLDAVQIAYGAGYTDGFEDARP